MMTKTVRVLGADKLAKRLKKLQNKEPIQNAMLATAEEIRREAEKLAPVDTGYLKSHMVVTNKPLNVEIEAKSEYAGYVEYGTRFMRAQPFLRPATDKAEPNYKKRLVQALEKNK